MVKAMMVKGKMEVRMGNVTREERDTRTDIRWEIAVAIDSLSISAVVSVQYIPRYHDTTTPGKMGRMEWQRETRMGIRMGIIVTLPTV
jgi:hypothetical protein